MPWKKDAAPEFVKENPVGVIDAGYVKNRPAPYCKRRILEQLSRHPLAVLCIRKKATEAAQARFVTDNPDIQAILDRPNPDYSGFRFRKMIYMSLAGLGDAFASEFREANGTFSEMWPIRMDRMTAVRDTDFTGRLTAWEYQYGSKKRIFQPEEVVHFQNDWITMDEFGLSVAETITDLLKYWDGYNEYNNRLLDGTQGIAALYALRNGAEPLSDTQMEQVSSMMRSFKMSVAGGNLGARGFFNAPMEKIDDSHNPSDMHVTEWFDRLTCMILNAYQVPPILLDVGSKATFENQKTALQSFWFNTLIPNYIQPVAEDLSRWLGVEVRVDYSQVRAIADAECERAVKVDSLNHLTINEKREMSGRDPVEGGDVIYTDSNKLPIDFGLNDTPEQVERSIQQAANKIGLKLVK